MKELKMNKRCPCAFEESLLCFCSHCKVTLAYGYQQVTKYNVQSFLDYLTTYTECLLCTNMVVNFGRNITVLSKCC